ALALVRSEQRELVRRAALLEGAGAVQVLQLEVDPGPAQLAERLGERAGGDRHDSADAVACRDDVLQGDHRGGRVTASAIPVKMRVGRVPLLFKALAAEKALVPCWNALRPAIRVRAFEEAADDMRARAARAAVDLGCPLIETQLEWAGYDVDEIDEIRGQVDIFHYADAKLLMAAAALLQALNGGVGGAKRGARAEQRVPRGVPQDMDHIELVPEEANGNLAKSFRSIRAHLGLGIVPDDFRAFGRWPKYLELAWADARKRDADPRAVEALKELATQADEAARQLPV